ncbi:MAG: hypothetical protein IPM68_14265 [Flavobacteriales bacterium]|nr:hypothetical protein [Flavobacteriales bacterium]
MVISDRTPWKGLERQNAGWDIPLEDPARFTRTIQLLVHMEEQALRATASGAFALGKRYLDDPAPVQRTLELLVP